MAWIKIPKEHHPILLAALPKDPRVRTVQMFGATAATVNGRLFGGLFARSAMVRLDPDGQREALALDGAEPFDPMGNKRVMADTVLLPETIMDEPDELRQWLARALAYTATLPPKQKKQRATKAPARRALARKAPATKAPARKAPARKAPATKTPARKAPAKKAPAKKGPARKAPAKAVRARNTAARRSASRNPARSR
jgi:TfoX/Sxy family transcriptional regulator of competence genes